MDKKTVIRRTDSAHNQHPGWRSGLAANLDQWTHQETRPTDQLIASSTEMRSLMVKARRAV